MTPSQQDTFKITSFQDIDADLHKKYVPFRHIDAGVSFCIPRHLLHPQHGRTPDVAQLMPHIVAVKIECDRVFAQLTSISREVKCIQNLNSHSRKGTNRRQFVQLLDHDTNTPCHWYAMSTYTSCLSVKDLLGAASSNAQLQGRVPREFILHYFVEVLSALRFLHNNCNMVHGDVHFGNVMLDTTSSKQHVPGFPNLVLIDFGYACVFEKKEKQKQFDIDRKQFCLTVYRMFTPGRTCVKCVKAKEHDDCTDPEGSKEFQEFMACMANWGQINVFAPQARGAYLPYFGYMWSRFGKWAVQGRQLVREEKRQEMKALTWDVAEANEKKLLEALQVVV
jgi:serine/threonine protein kinase